MPTKKKEIEKNLFDFGVLINHVIVIHNNPSKV
jgi:hypothetical protein